MVIHLKNYFNQCSKITNIILLTNIIYYRYATELPILCVSTEYCRFMRVDAGGCGHGADVYSVLLTPMGIDLHARALTRTCPQMFSKSRSANPVQKIRKTALVSACFENLCRDAVLVCPARLIF